MKNHLVLLILLGLFGGSISNAQEIPPSDYIEETPNKEAQVLELIAIFNDAIDAPTNYNAYVNPFIKEVSFPLKQNLSKQEYDTQLEKWINDNPLIIDKFLEVRQKAHDELYGKREN